MKIPDNEVDRAVQITEDTLHIHLDNVPTVDAFSFPPPPQAVPGISPFRLIPAKVSFDITYTKKVDPKTGETLEPRRIRPGSHDPLSPLNWAGKMWDATNSGTFSVIYDDKSFSASGTFDSAGNFGEMGTERNGVFVNHKEDDEQDGDTGSLPSVENQVSHAQVAHTMANALAKPRKTVLLKGRVPINVNY